jgi:hypothetical protein
MIEVRCVIADVHMGSGHKGLNQIIQDQKKLNIDVRKALGKDGLVLFINAKRTAGKLFRQNGEVLGYLRMHEGMIISEKQVNKVCEAFGGQLAYSQTFREQLKLIGIIEKKAKKVGQIKQKKHPAPKYRGNDKRDSEGRAQL